ncbi:hypothetical protein B0H11DRAFT_1917999 [Mycena galericulata]|nr:hypothetical protein B0H11DRAFT_1938663 [Mycena galericulata]KAJ7475307.1 hypothetical protein B0H11DRAFT_1917999 [Mycena galericulata]
MSYKFQSSSLLHALDPPRPRPGVPTDEARRPSLILAVNGNTSTVGSLIACTPQISTRHQPAARPTYPEARHYYSPSATSRKPTPPGADEPEIEEIERKRAMQRDYARASRVRKEQQRAELEDTIKVLRREIERLQSENKRLSAENMALRLHRGINT